MPPKSDHHTLDLNTLTPAELEDLKGTVDSEIQGLAQSVLALQKAAGEFGSAGRSIERLAEQNDGQETLLPLTSSLYVRGTLEDTEKFLVNIGTGYYVEMTGEEGCGYCKRKVNFIREQLDQIGQVIKQRQVIQNQVTAVLQRKLAQQQAPRQPPTKVPGPS